MNGSSASDLRVRCGEIKEAKDASGLPFLVQCLSGGERGVQDAAFEALSCFSTPATAKLVLPLLRSPDERVRNLAREILAPLGRSSAEEILPYLKDPDPNVQIFAVELLGAWKEPALVEELGLLASSGHPNVRSQVAITLGQSGLPQAALILGRLCRDEDEWVCFAAIEALERMGDEASREVLRGCLSGDDPLLSRAALDALLAQNSVEAASIVVEALEVLAADASSLARAVRGLLGFKEGRPAWTPGNTQSVEKALSATLRTGSTWERARAVRLGGLLGLEALRGPAEALAGGPSGPDRIEAIEALGRLRGEASKLLLESLLGDPDADVVERSRQALDRGKSS